MSGEKKKRIYDQQDEELFRHKLDGVYYYRGTPPGAHERVERSLGTTDRQAARAKKAELIAELSRNGVQGSRLRAGPLMQDFVKDYKENCLRDKKALRTSNEIESLHRLHLGPYFSTMKIGQIDQLEFQKYCQFKGQMDFKGHRKFLNLFLDWCIVNRAIKARPKFTCPKWDRRLRIPLTDEEVVRLVENLEGRITLYVMLYLFMGMRSGEILKLQWDRIDFQNQAIILFPKDVKTKKARIVTINTKVFQILVTLKEKAKSPYVFPNRRGKFAKVPHMRDGAFRTSWKKLLDRAEIKKPVTPHDLRATFETHVLANKDFTKEQKEMYTGADMEVMKSIYVRYQADQLRGLEESVKIDGLDQILEEKVSKLKAEKGFKENKKLGESAGESLLLYMRKRKKNA